MKEDVEMNDKTEIKTDKISYRKYYRQMISTVGKRDTNDELTQQTTAKVNQTFITFLFTIACLFISVMTLFSDILGRFKVTLNEYVITGLIWFCYAVYNFIGLYFESKFDDDEN